MPKASSLIYNILKLATGIQICTILDKYSLLDDVFFTTYSAKLNTLLPEADGMTILNSLLLITSLFIKLENKLYKSTHKFFLYYLLLVLITKIEFNLDLFITESFLGRKPTNPHIPT